MCMIIFLRIIILSHQIRILSAGLSMAWNRDGLSCKSTTYVDPPFSARKKTFCLVIFARLVNTIRAGLLMDTQKGWLVIAFIPRAQREREKSISNIIKGKIVSSKQNLYAIKLAKTTGIMKKKIILLLWVTYRLSQFKLFCGIWYLKTNEDSTVHNWFNRKGSVSKTHKSV